MQPDKLAQLHMKNDSERSGRKKLPTDQTSLKAISQNALDCIRVWIVEVMEINLVASGYKDSSCHRIKITYAASVRSAELNYFPL